MKNRSRVVALRLKSIVDARIAKGLSMISFNAFAQKNRVSESALSAQFRRLTGKSFRLYVEISRVDIAMSMIRHGGRSLAKISSLVELKDERNLRHAFKVVLGNVPSVFTRAYKIMI